MDLDITGKVGIENAHELLQEKYDVASMDLETMKMRNELHWKVRLQEEYVRGLEEALAIITINLPTK